MPSCLAEYDEPYFRLAGRLGLYTFCPKHQTLLHVKCWNCGAPVAFHRIELGKPEIFDITSLDECWQCGESLKKAGIIPVQIANKTSLNMWSRVLGAIQRDFVNCGPINYDRLVLLHQICKLLSLPRYSTKLTDYIISNKQIHLRIFTYPDLMAWWPVGKTNKKIRAANNGKAINVHYLYKNLSGSSLQQLNRIFEFVLDSGLV